VSDIQTHVKNYSSQLDENVKELAIILAAGHGKRLKSDRSKMPHTIWDVPTVERVYNACKKGVDGINTVIVVSIKAEDVMEHLDESEEK